MININNLYKKYNDIVVLDNFSASLPGKGAVCFLGPSGCGKTTLLNILAGVIKADRGLFDGLQNKKISCVFQEDRLLTGKNALYNINFVLPKNNRYIAGDLFEKMQLSEFIDKPCKDFSGGMKRRVAIIRCIAYGGDVYLLDEPFKGLDFSLKNTVMDIFAEKAKNALVVFITHDLEEAVRLSDKIYVSGGPPFFIKGEYHLHMDYWERKKSSEYINKSREQLISQEF